MILQASYFSLGVGVPRLVSSDFLFEYILFFLKCSLQYLDLFVFQSELPVSTLVFLVYFFF